MGILKQKTGSRMALQSHFKILKENSKRKHFIVMKNGEIWGF